MDAMIDRCAAIGYPQITVASLCAYAGISTATFYEQFADREACLCAACGAAARRILPAVGPPLRARHPDALRRTLESLLTAARRDPDAAHVLFVAVLAGGTRARRERDRALEGLERSLEATLAGSPHDQARLDLPAVAVTGAISALLARAEYACEPPATVLLDQLMSWALAFQIPAARSRRSVTPDMLTPAGAQPLPPSTAGVCPGPRRRLPRGRHRLPTKLVARIQRERLLDGVAQVTFAKGYADATVTDIVAAAGVARGVFYEHFRSKQEAFAAAQDHANTELLSHLARAYFTRSEWPERVSSVLQALTGLLVANPAHAHLRLLDCYAAGPVAVERTERLRAAAAIFLFEGLGYASPAQVSESAAHASIGAAFELLQRDLAAGDPEMMVRRLPQLTYLATAPFIGVDAAERHARELAAPRSAPG